MRTRTDKGRRPPKPLSGFKRLDALVDQGWLYKLRPTELRLYMALHIHADHESARCFPSQDRLARLTIPGWAQWADQGRRPSRTQIRRALHELERHGLVYVERSGGGGRNHAIYVLGPFADQSGDGANVTPSSEGVKSTLRDGVKSALLTGQKSPSKTGRKSPREPSIQPSKEQINEPKRPAAAPPSAAFDNFGLGRRKSWADLPDHKQRECLEELSSQLLSLGINQSVGRKIARTFLRKHGSRAASRIIRALVNRKKHDNDLPRNYAGFVVSIFKNPVAHIERLAEWLPAKPDVTTKTKRKIKKRPSREWISDPLAD